MTYRRAAKLFALPCLLALPVLAQPQIGGGTCNSSTLSGTYELLLTGRQVTSTGAISKVFHGTGTAAFDGQSKVTLTMTANIVSTAQNFGTPLVYSGTYSLQTNCLGTVNITSGDAVSFNLESFNSGNTFQLYGSDATYAYSGGGNLQPSACPTTLMGVHEFSSTGNTISGTSFTGTLVLTGVLNFDGQGNVTATWTQASNSNMTNVSATGTYTVTPGCLASASLTDTASNKYTVSLSIYSTAPDFVLTVASPLELFDGSGAAALPASTAGTCSASTLNGTYELLLAGRQVTAAGSTVKIMQGAGAATFDGQSKVTFMLTANTVNGSQAFGAPVTYSGTYTVQPNCMGSISITAGDTATFALVAYSVNANTMVANDFSLAGSDANFAFNGSGVVQPAACSVGTLSGSWLFSATGSTLSGSTVSGVADVLGLLTFDGQGNVTNGSWTTSSNTANTAIMVTGTYSMTSACLGTITMTDSSNNKYAWALSVDGAAANNFVFAASNPTAVYTGTGRAAFVNPGLAVVNGASDVSGGTPPGSVFTVFGSGLATGQAQPSNIPLPTTVLTTTVTVNGEAAPIFYLNPTQINAQMPEDIQPGLATVIVKNGSATSNAVAVAVPTAAPGISVYGQNQAVVVNQNGSVNSPTATAKVGDVVVAYFTGGGAASGAGKLTTGAPTPNSLWPLTGTSSITVNGKAAASVAYIGLTPGGIGLYQANFTIPQVVAGSHPLVITIGGQASNRPLITIGN